MEVGKNGRQSSAQVPHLRAFYALRWDSPAASIFGFADTNDRLKPDD